MKVARSPATYAARYGRLAGRPERRWARGAALGCALVLGCTRCGGADQPGPSSTPVPTCDQPGCRDGDAPDGGPPDGAATDGGESPQSPAGWRDALRIQDWEHALELLRALPEAERAKPAMRLARGRAALAAGHHDEAARALRGLDEELPAVKAEARRWYAEAAAVAGPHEEAAKLLAQSGRVADLIVAAQAFERGGKVKEALRTGDKAVKRADRNRRSADAVRARMARAAIAERAGQKALAIVDWQWIVGEQPDAAEVRAALAGLARHDVRVRLEAELTALTESTTADNLKVTLDRLDALAAANKPMGPLIAVARGKALYGARSYTRARDGLDYAAALVSPYQAEAVYYAARAAERAGDAAGALSRFETVTRRYATSGWAERAAYQRAQLLLYRGSYAEATQAFVTYLSHFGKSKWAKEARYGHALAQLSTGAAAKAKETFVALGKEEGINRPFRALLRQLEGVAALRAGRRDTAVSIWRELMAAEPLTYPALAAHARLAALGLEPVPPLIGAPPAGAHVPVAVTLPPGAALLHGLGLDDAAERRLARMEQDLAAHYPGRESEALCAMYGLLAGGRRQQRIGNRAASFEVLMRPPSAADRWAWDCVYPRPYGAHVAAEEQRQGIPPGLVHAIMRQESAFRGDAISPAGAQGLMQLMPTTAVRAARELGEHVGVSVTDVFRPDVNISLGAFYIGKLLKGFGGSIPLAVAGYNAGPHAVERWLACGTDREADLWIARIPFYETRTYVARVLGNFARYQYLAGGAEAVTPLSLELPTKVTIGDDPY